MITFFTTPKAFTGQFQWIQRNAIKSWTSLGAEVILFGNDYGFEKEARELSVRCIPEVRRNVFGTPLLSDIFQKVYTLASNPILTYINADIILLPDFLKAVKQISFKKYLLMGQRRPVVVSKEIVGKNHWQTRVQKMIKAQKSTPRLGSSDFFTFPKAVYFPMPAFAAGRMYWDRWLIFYAKALSISIINATETITAVHQQHYPNPNDHQYGEAKLGKEAKINGTLLGHRIYCLSIYDADFKLKKKGLEKPVNTLLKRLRNIEIRLIVASKRSMLAGIIPKVLLALRDRIKSL